MNLFLCCLNGSLGRVATARDTLLGTVVLSTEDRKLQLPILATEGKL
jgi:hypothetical protein